MADIKDWTALAKPDQEWEETIKSIGGSGPDIGMFPDIPSLRQWIRESKLAMSAAISSNIPGVTQQDHQVSMRDGSSITCRVYTPEKEGGALGVAFHGGGWCIGDLESEELMCRRCCTKLGMVMVNVDYRLAPEHRFPTAVYDCHDATKWAAKEAKSWGADPTKGFIVMGTSAGGNLTAVISHLYRDEGSSPPITGLHLMIPALVYHAYVPARYKADYRSWEQNKDAAILSLKACKLFYDNYIPDENERKSELFSPLLWEKGHKNVPASYFQICGADPLRDDALIFERLLREEEGIKTKVDVYSGLPHGFWVMFPQMKASQRFVDDSVKGMQWLLQQK